MPSLHTKDEPSITTAEINTEARVSAPSPSPGLSLDTAVPEVKDIWSNPEALRIDQSFLNTGAAKKLLTTVPIRKPNKQDFVRVHPSPEYRLTVALIELKESRETYLVMPQ